MNLTLQTRRAMITLGLAAAAVVCVAARSAVAGDEDAANGRTLRVESNRPAPTETTHVIVTHVRSGDLVTFIRHHTARAH